MTLILNVGRALLNLIYTFYKLFPTRNRIAIISRQSQKPSEDIVLLREEIKRQAPGVEVVVMCKMIDPGVIGKIKYLLYMFRCQMYVIATSKVVILDGYCIAISILKHKSELKVIQMWHAMGALKKFGYCSVGEREGSSSKIAHSMKMHKNYDVIFVSSEECKHLLAPAYRCSEDIMEVMPLPRVDLITQEKYQKIIKEKIYKVYPQLIGKETILYAPTFRKERNMEQAIKNLLNSVDYSKYNLVVKLHPLEHNNFQLEKVVFDDKFSSIDMLTVADYVITDYSAFIFEAAIAGKPIYRYVPDKCEYKGERGFFIDIDYELPDTESISAKDVIAKIEKKEYDLAKIKTFSDKYIQNNGHCTETITKYILQLISGGHYDRKK